MTGKTYRRLASLLSRGVAVLLSGLLATPQLAWSQQPAGAAQPPHELHITILEGEGALNNIRERTAREPIIQVEDENHKPVSEAAVVFLINGGDHGAGATFNGLSSFTTRTDSTGRAVGRGLQPNQQTGNFTISVSVTVGTLAATAIIHQVNRDAGAAPEANTSQPTTAKAGGLGAHIPRPFHTGRGIGITVGVVATVGIVVGVLAANSGGGNSTQITAGQGTVGPPSLRVHLGR